MEIFGELIKHIPNITSGFSLIAFIGAIIFLIYSLQMKHQIDVLEKTPEKDRMKVIEASLGTYRLTEDNLTREQKYDLVKITLLEKSQRYKIRSIVFVCISLILATVIVFITSINKNSPIATGERKDSLNKSTKQKVDSPVNSKPDTTRKGKAPVKKHKQFELSGLVVDNDRNSLGNVEVFCATIGKTIKTNENGSFKFLLPESSNGDGNIKLVFNKLGYESWDFEYILPKNNIEVILKKRE